ncbi:hypothetical protein ND861_08840 [Leptospira sp. 2 VSF19]|uniref:Transcriptional regulator n=1 Tax=Leptospira soteropolitanensis TaxID=2950025 RepID=A0AAW5VCX5_9LEPT|nr:hypothetical protein [Leptospira soteropolitanensis]MCW7492692.1 hypothetical protein [Leptospira soteropolitanensis]MCW7500375.1 hypothetical protein [Leptospira soteropolitanensis]MCW7522590.1 hypothetical protein [Leptospira soteropolitanensis]MCW7526446.1 hypothetical protein [Leptospira soteropolitanensis]MCW7530345.1 hypothetical protein [Leptospira soteropolitanensis]
MKLEKAKLITIIADEAIQDRLVQELKFLSVKGYTISDAIGEGINQKHLTSWEGKNIRLESLVSETKAKKIFEIMTERYIDKYPMVIFMSDVEVIRKDRFN